MEFIRKPPEWLTDALPEDLKDLLQGWVWWALLGFIALLLVLIVWAIVSKIRGSFDRKEAVPHDNLAEDLESIPAPAPSTGDRRLTVDGVPVRLRLVVVAPSGVDTEINAGHVQKLLDHVVVGLGEIAANDKPVVRIWPAQLSYEGFAHAFHRNTPIPEGEHQPSPWVLVAGRAKIGTNNVMLGLGLLSIRPTTLGRRTLKMHEWPETFRIKVRE
jgi:hypothetical protein